MTYIASDWQEVRIKRLLSWRTRNYVGMTFGGSIYGGVDPVDAEGSRPGGVRKTVTVSTDESKTV